MIHTLKINPDSFQAIIDGDKKAEFRNNDRAYNAGDILVLQEWIPERYTGRSRKVLVTHAQGGYGIPAGHLMLSIELIPEEKGECIMQCGCDPVFFDGESCKSCGKKANQGGKPYVDNDIPNAEFKKDQTYTNQGGEGHQGAFQGGAVSGTIAEEEPVCDECRKCGNRYCSHQNPSEEHSLKNCLEKVRGSAKGTTTPCPTCGLTENGMTVEEEGALKKEIEERENEPSMFIEELRKPSELVTGKQTLDHVPTALEEFIKRHDEEERAWRRAVVREINGLSGLSIEVYKPQSLSKFL